MELDSGGIDFPDVIWLDYFTIIIEMKRLIRVILTKLSELALRVAYARKE